MIEIITSLTQDKIIFWAIQALIVSLSLLGVLNEILNKRSGRAVKRGEKGNTVFYIFYGIISVILLQIVSITKEAEGYKVFFIILDLLLVLYLCFFNSWSRNKIIGIYGKFENKIERL